MALSPEELERNYQEEQRKQAFEANYQAQRQDVVSPEALGVGVPGADELEFHEVPVGELRRIHHSPKKQDAARLDITDRINKGAVDRHLDLRNHDPHLCDNNRRRRGCLSALFINSNEGLMDHILDI